MATTKKTDQVKGSAPLKKSAPAKNSMASVTLLSGGNPQIAKGHGDEVVQEFIAAMAGWKQDVGRWLDEMITRIIQNEGIPTNALRPGLRKQSVPLSTIVGWRKEWIT